MTPPHLRGDAIRVLATPDMVRLVEQTAIQSVQPHLKPGQTTVGTVINIKHLAATPEGMKTRLADHVESIAWTASSTERLPRTFTGKG